MSDQDIEFKHHPAFERELESFILRGNTTAGRPWMRAVAKGGAAREEEDATGGSPWRLHFSTLRWSGDP